VSRALKQLESAQIITRVPYQEPGRRAHDEYQLTEAGEDLLPVLLSLMQWGDKYLQEGRAPLSFVETSTARAMKVRVTADPVPETTSGNIEIRLHPAWRRRH
jgi:DNA-binding PadR family transcriptional regulator